MKSIRFLGPAHVLRVAGLEIKRGEVADVPKEAVKTMIAYPQLIRLEVLKPAADSGEGPKEPVRRHGKEDKE